MHPMMLLYIQMEPSGLLILVMASYQITKGMLTNLNCPPMFTGLTHQPARLP
jgi:hypothetical protein